ncbi:MAG: hypothetical protein NC324_09750 [Bacteroides sp.]|nr:hypothetical protein [Bacteroides sp.]
MKQQLQKKVETTYGMSEGEICGRDGCKGIIAKRKIEGSCSCHINPPCAYCTTPKEYCPECGWDASEEIDYSDHVEVTPFVYRTPKECFERLKDGEFGYVVWNTFPGGMIVKGKHPNMGMQEILKRLGCADKYSMAQFKEFTDKEFKVSYYTD